MGSSKPIALLVFAGVLGGAYWTLRTPTEVTPPKPPAVEPQKAPVPDDAPVPVKVDFQVPPDSKIPPEQRLLMPDGSFVPTLNGVKNPGKIVWGDAPYSPIVRKQIDPTLEWYVHADGTYTTTMMQWRSDLGREDAVTLCLHPAAATAIEGAPDEGTIGPTKK